MGLEKRSTVGSSGEYWSIGETLNWHFVEMRDSPKGNREGYGSCKVDAKSKRLIVCQKLRTSG